MPDIALVYAARSPNISVETPVVLTWRKDRYKADEQASPYLDNIPARPTIADIRDAMFGTGEC